MRLPFAVKSLFEKWLEQNFPERKEKILNRIRSMRGGKLNDPNFGSRMRGDGIFADQIAQTFAVACRARHYAGRWVIAPEARLDADHFEVLLFSHRSHRKLAALFQLMASGQAGHLEDDLARAPTAILFVQLSHSRAPFRHT